MPTVWVLVLLTLTKTEPVVEKEGIYPTMIACFEARDPIMDPENPNRPDQAVCLEARRSKRRSI